MKKANNEIKQLRQELLETKEVLNAIREGAVDAIVVENADGNRIFTLEGADHSYRVLVESINEGAATLMSDGTILYSNSRLAAMLSTPVEKLTGSSLLNYGAPDSRDTIKALISRALKKESKSEIHLKGPDGTFPALLSLKPYEDNGHRYLSLVATDMTEQKKIEKVRQANETLTRADKIRSEMTSMISHELRTPLSALKEGINLVLDEVEGPITQEQKETLEITRRNVDRLGRLVENILTFNKDHLRKNQISLASHELVSLVHDICLLMTLSASTKEIKILQEIPPPPLWVVCDADKIRQVLINLIDNAIKYTPIKGEIRVHVSSLEDQVRIEVKDTGPGISPEEQKLIFKMFHRSPKDVKKASGTGIGLSVCKKLIGQHGGKISVRSQPGNGATFIIVFPTNLRVAA